MPDTTGLSGVTVDTEAMRSASTALTSITQAFATDDSISYIAVNGIGACEGTKPLKEAIEKFSSRWSIRRSEVKARMEQLAGAVTMVADNFESVEAQLSNAIQPVRAVASGPNAPIPAAYWESQ